MGNTTLNLPNIRSYLLSQSTVTDITDTRIFISSPQSVNGIYIVMEIIADERDNMVERSTIVEFRFMAHNNQTTLQSLINLKDAVTNLWCPENENDLVQPTSLSWQTVNRVIEWSNLSIQNDNNGGPYIIKDYIFYY